MRDATHYRMPPDNREFDPETPLPLRPVLLHIEGLRLSGMPHALGDPTELLARLPQPDDAPTEAARTYAYVSDDRWVCDCPWCSGATLTSRDDPRFLCPYCLNAAAGYKFVEVVWPDDDEQAEAERLLLRRAPLNRHWMPATVPEDVATFPSQTVDELSVENVENGVES